MTRSAFHMLLLHGALLLLAISDGRAAPAELTASRARFEKYLQTLEQDYRTEQASQQKSYRTALENLMQKAQQDGDLDALLRVKDEQSRFDRVPVLTQRMMAADPGPLQALQKRYLATIRESAVTHGRAVIALCESYAASLEKLESRLTVAGDFDAALEVRTARLAREWDAAAKAAKFEMAFVDVESPAEAARRAPDPRAKVEERAPVQRPVIEPEKESVGPENYVENGIYIYLAGSPPRTPGLTYKRADLTRTAKSAVRTPLGISAQMAREEATDAKANYVCKDTGWRLRLSLSAMLNLEEETDVTLVVQYYTRPRIDRGKISPRLSLTRRVPLTLSPGKSLVVDYPPFNVWSGYVKGGAAYGNAYYGFTISVFDAKGSPLHQVTSVRELSDDAPVELPGPGPEESADVLLENIERAKGGVKSARAQLIKDPRNSGSSMRLLEAQWALKTLSDALQRISEE